MRPNSRLNLAAVAARRLVVLLISLWPAMALAAPQSVGDFLKLRAKWKELDGTSHRLEGRLGAINDNNLLLRKLPLIIESSTPLPSDIKPGDSVEVVVEIAHNEMGLAFLKLRNLSSLGTDMSRVTRWKADLPIDEPDRWYNLAEWVRARAAFYSDEELEQTARTLFADAITRERINLKEPSFDELKRLSEKAQKYGLGEALRLQYVYEGHYLEYERHLREASPTDLSRMAGAIATDLPKASTPMDIDAATRDAWRDQPLSWYINAMDTQRETAHRLLYQEVMLSSINKRIAPDGSNGHKIAELFELHLPEMKKAAVDQRARYREFRYQHLKQLSREDMLKLRQEYLDLGEQERADETLQVWFLNREFELRNQGFEGLLQLASEFETLMNDERRAIDTLREADRQKPGSGYVAGRLEAYGFRQVDGLWQTEDEARRQMETPVRKAMREGRVIRGMTTSEVQRTLGNPSATMRVLSSTGLMEYWVYDTSNGNGPRLTVQFSRPRQREGLVLAISELAD